jgi:hypothetical protein
MREYFHSFNLPEKMSEACEGVLNIVREDLQKRAVLMRADDSVVEGVDGVFHTTSPVLVPTFRGDHDKRSPGITGNNCLFLRHGGFLRYFAYI